jgi:hypothetical protein
MVVHGGSPEGQSWPCQCKEVDKQFNHLKKPGHNDKE